MSLLAEATESCKYYDKTTQADGYGGFKTVWQLGAAFDAAIVLDTSLEARKAQKEGVNNVYTVATSRQITLMHGDVFTRLSDSKIFRVTSDGTDKKTPGSASLDMRVVSAEQLDALPN